jgi:parallel beta-helix repeat protein
VNVEGAGSLNATSTTFANASDVAISLNNGTNIDIHDCYFFNNSGTTIYLLGGSLNVSNSQFDLGKIGIEVQGTQTTISNSQFSRFTNLAVSLLAGGKYGNTSGTVTGCTFSSNNQSISVQGSELVCVDSNFTQNTYGIIASYNSSTNVIRGEFTSNRLGIQASTSSSLAVLGTTFTSSLAATAGGAIYAANSPYVSLTSITAVNNSGRVSGGAVFLQNITQAIIVGSTFANNTLGVLHATYSAVALTNCTFTGNDAPSGVTSTFNCLLNITECEFTSNTGCAIYSQSDFLVNIVSSTIQGNGGLNQSQGGGLEILKTNSCSITNSTVANNNAIIGGGLYASGSQITLTSSQFFNNTAQNYGGGAYLVTQVVNTFNTTFANNTATQGAGVYSEVPQITCANTNFTSNVASQDGGGLMLQQVNGSALLTQCYVSKNTASQQGGGMYSQNSNLTLSGCTISENNVPLGTGGGLWNSGTSIIEQILREGESE